jgi:hypothetical protein
MFSPFPQPHRTGLNRGDSSSNPTPLSALAKGMTRRGKQTVARFFGKGRDVFKQTHEQRFDLLAMQKPCKTKHI